MTEEQKKAASERLAKARENMKKNKQQFIMFNSIDNCAEFAPKSTF